jgi:hypothetical protein
MNAKKLLMLTLVSSAVAGCAPAESGSGERGSYEVREIEGGLEVVLPEIEIAASGERMLCSYVRLPGETDLWVRGFRGVQEPGGHHLAGFLVAPGYEVVDGSVEDCTDPAAMVELRPLLTGTADNQLELPDGFAVRVPAGALLAFQSHYVNASAESIFVRDRVEIWISPDATPTPVANFATALIDFEIPPQQTHTETYRCLSPSALDVFIAFGHMHEYGAAISIEAGPANDRTVIYDVPEWTAEHRDEPPLAEWPVASPLHFAANEPIDVTCTWQSTAAEPLRFPQEMCAAVFWIFPAEEPLTCSGTAL